MFLLRSIRKFANTNWTEKRLLCKSFLLTVGLRLLPRLLPFRKTLALVQRLASSSAASTARRPSMNRIIWAVTAAARRLAPTDRPCLTQALVLFILFRRHDYAADLYIGVRKNDHGELQAHAWVESNTRVVIGGLPNLSDYTTLPSLKL